MTTDIAIEVGSRAAWKAAKEITGNLVDKLRLIMKANGFNQSQLAEHLGVDRSQITRWLTGNQEPGLFHAIWIHKWANELQSQH